MKILIACEYSGIVRESFKAKGHYVLSCDFLPTEIEGNHYQGDVFDIINDGWDLMIAHPPCTYLCNSGVRWLYNKDKSKNEERWKSMRDGAEFFKMLLSSKIERIAIENPIMHKHAMDIIKVRPTQTIQPYQFGHGETKATCLWLKNLPLIKPTNIVEGREARVHKMSPSINRWKERSRTYTGIAEAFANTWNFMD